MGILASLVGGRHGHRGPESQEEKKWERNRVMVLAEA